MSLADWSAFDRPATGSGFRAALYTLWSAVAGLLSAAGDPPAFVLQRNKITENVTIPDGYNALAIGTMEVSPDVTVTGEGNSTWVGIG